MKRTEPPLGPADFCVAFVESFSRLIAAAVTEDIDARRAIRAELRCTTPAAWCVWSDDRKLLAQRHPHQAATTAELALFGRARALIASVLAHLTLEERIFLIERLDEAREPAPGDAVGAFVITTDLIGASWGCCVEVVWNSMGHAKVASFGGCLSERREAAAA